MRKKKLKQRQVPVLNIIFHKPEDIYEIIADEKFVAFAEKHAFDAIKEGISSNAESLNICEIGGQNAYISIPRNRWKNVLEKLISKHEKLQNFEFCQECVKLISQI